MTGAQITLLLFSALGFWTLWGFPYNNNLLTFLGQLSESGASVPGPTYHAMRQEFTGIGPVDKQLTTLVGFFYTAIDGNRIDISLTFLNLGSQVLAAWMLITTERYRAGNKNSVILTSITTLGIAIAIIGYAAVTPIWFALHLMLSKTVINPKEFNIVLEQPIRMAIAPIATMIGFGVPSAVMALPTSYITVNTKLIWTAIQQGWPIWIFFTQRLLEFVASWSSPMVSMRTEKQKRDETIKYMKRAYQFAVMSSAGAHLLFTGLGLAAWLVPEMLSAKLQVQLYPDNFFIPANPFGDEKASTLANGALWFLQWDLIVGVFSTMIWGIAVNLSAEGKQRDVGAWLSALANYGTKALVVGPSGAAVLAIKDRDMKILKAKKA